MSLTNQDIEAIAHLARLGLSDTETQNLATDLNKIINFIQILDEIDTKTVKPLAHPMDAKQRLRQDTVTETVDRDVFLTQAPEQHAGLYLVPEVIES